MPKLPRTLESAFRKYQVLGVLGEGGAGRALLVRDESGCEFAAKILHPDRMTAERRRRFQNEIAFCQQAVHPNVLRVLDYGAVKMGAVTVPFYVMRRYEHSLREAMVASQSTNKTLALFGQLLDGVEAAHRRGVVHRDLKPENVLVNHESDTLVVADFGVAHFCEEELYTAVETKAAARLANFRYAAPEQKDRGQPVGPTADIYALGLILNELFTRSVPLGTGFTTIRQVHPELSYLDDIVDLMLRQQSTRRPQTIDAVKQEFTARRKELLTRQELDVITRQVVPVGATSDPFIDDPPRIIDFDWARGLLTLTLSRMPSAEWITAFQNIGSRTSVLGADITDFQFRGDKAIVRADDNRVQEVIDRFKGWIPKATAVYRLRREQQRQLTEAEERKRLERERDQKERQLRLRQDIRL